MAQADREWWAEQQRQRAVLRQQQAANAAQQQQQAGQLAARDAYAQQIAAMDRQAAHAERSQLVGYAAQSALSQQAHAQGMESATHHVDLQARLNEVQLNQAEVQRMNRMHQARASVEDNPDLSPQERRMLITQIESGLNPLENRQREQQMIFSTLQSQGLHQQNEQQATLFQQRQERLAAGAEGRMRSFTNPGTGASQMFMMDLNGEWHPLDFSQSDQMMQARLEATQAGTEHTRQQTTQSQALLPGQVQGQGLTNQGQQLQNQQLQQHLDYSAQIQPHQVQRAALANMLTTQQIMQGADLHRGALELQGAHIDDLRQRIFHAADLHEDNAALQRASVLLRQQQVEQGPEAFTSQQAYQDAATRLTEARIRQMNAEMNAPPTNPLDAERRRYATTLSTTMRHFEDQARQEVQQWQRPTAGQQRQRPSWLPPNARPDSQDMDWYIRNRAWVQSQDHLRMSGIQSPDDQQAPPAQPADANPQQRPPAQQPLGAAAQGVAQQLGQLPEQQQQGANADLTALQGIMGRFPGGFGTMPPEVQQEVMRLRTRLRDVRPDAPAPQVQPRRPWWEDVWRSL